MRIWPFILLLFFVACSSGPSRYLASTEGVVLGDVDHSKSVVKLFLNAVESKEVQYFYIELRDFKNNLVDISPGEFQVKLFATKIDFKVRRLSVGRYEIAIFQDISSFEGLKFLVSKKILKHQLLTLKKPHRSHSHLKILANHNHELTLELSLKDKNGKAVEMIQMPEIMIEGNGIISDMSLVRKGVWHFQVNYSEDNQIMYFSVRGNGVYLERLQRFQHIEK
jgi:hypothetical protein